MVRPLYRGCTLIIDDDSCRENDTGSERGSQPVITYLVHDPVSQSEGDDADVTMRLPLYKHNAKHSKLCSANVMYKQEPGRTQPTWVQLCVLAGP